MFGGIERPCCKLSDHMGTLELIIPEIFAYSPVNSLFGY